MTPPFRPWLLGANNSSFQQQGNLHALVSQGHFTWESRDPNPARVLVPRKLLYEKSFKVCNSRSGNPTGNTRLQALNGISFPHNGKLSKPFWQDQFTGGPQFSRARLERSNSMEALIWEKSCDVGTFKRQNGTFRPRLMLWRNHYLHSK